MFMMINIALRAGLCKKPQKVPLVHCQKLGTDNMNFGLDQTTSSESTLCTKVALSQMLIKVARLADADAREHYAAVKGRGDNAVARCEVRKEVNLLTSEILSALDLYSRHCVHRQCVTSTRCAMSTRPWSVGRCASSPASMPVIGNTTAAVQPFARALMVPRHAVTLP